jgi:3-oxoacyl-[acyl-carrier protein] reductase
MKLSNKIAIVTGAGRGIGRAIALGYAREGASLVICSRTDDQIRSVQEEIGHLGGRCIRWHCDVRREDDAKQLVERTLQEFGRVDILVNNAAVGMGVIRPDFMERPVPFWEIDATQWSQITDTNFKGVFLCSKAVVPQFIQQGSGKIINLTGGPAIFTRKGFSAYGPSKAGMEALTKVIAVELEEYGVCVNLLAPGGGTDTDLVPKKEPRLLKPEIVVPAAVYLASEEVSYTGQIIRAKEWNEDRGISI